MDDDGVSIGKRIPIRVKVEVARRPYEDGSERGRCPGRRASTILAKPPGISCCQVAFKCLTSPLDLPINDGQFRAIDVVLPPGKVVSAVQPSAMRMWMTVSDDVIDTIFKALAPALPEQGHGRPPRRLVVARVSGRRPEDNSSIPIQRSDRRRLGRQARQRWHDTRPSPSMTATRTTARPSRSRRNFRCWSNAMRLRPDSGGAGEHRGGLGTEQVVQARAQIRFMRRSIASNADHGVFTAASLASAIRLRSIASVNRNSNFDNGKAFNLVLNPGDAYIQRSGRRWRFRFAARSRPRCARKRCTAGLCVERGG